ncbi:MAG: sigma factor-like helix-turn-helix DNA-binding protein [Geminicoccaceae bacterium]
MFRISKNDESIERPDPGDDQETWRPSTEGPVSSVGSSALRWLRGAKSADGPPELADDIEQTQVLHLTDVAEADDHIELSNPIHATVTDNTPGKDKAEPAPAPRLVKPSAPKVRPPLDYDDDDDIGDFDDFGDLDGTLPPAPVQRTSYLAGIDAEALVPPAAPEVHKTVPAEAEDELDNHAVDAPQGHGHAAGEAEAEEAAPKPASHPPSAPVDPSLSLSPIPELQPESEQTSAQSSQPSSDSDNGNEGERTSNTGLGAMLRKSDRSEGENQNKAGRDHAEEAIDDDWHAQLADVVERDEAPVEARPQHQPETMKQPANAGPEDLPVFSLSKPRTPLATSEKPEADEDDLPIPPLLSKTLRKKNDFIPPLSSHPANASDLSPEQLSLGIVANVPRLRRFAAVQIGDEPEADRLVQITTEMALANPAALETAGDLGFALITLLCRQRNEMLHSSSSLPRTAEEARAFETSVCRALAGADQFEIHQFARAMNGLDEQDRVLLVMVALENFSYEQVSEIIGVPTEQVMAEVTKARMSLRQSLAVDEARANGESSAANTPHAHEVEIHGYLDGELGPDHMADIDALVEEDEDAADLLMHYGIQGDLIRRLYAPLLNRPIPGSMLHALSTSAKPTRWGFRFMPRRALRASSLMITLGALFSQVAAVFSTVIDR